MRTATHFQNHWDSLNRELEACINHTAQALLGSANSIERDVAHYGVYLGAHEPILNGHPLLESLQVTTDGLFIQLELIEEYAAFGEITTLSMPDKIVLLSVLQSELPEPRYT